MIPFITEEVWQLLGTIAPERGLTQPQPRRGIVIVATWPEPDAGAAGRGDRGRVCAVPGGAVGAARDSQPAEHSAEGSRCRLRCAATRRTAALLQPMEPYFESMAEAKATLGRRWSPPATSATCTWRARRVRRPGGPHRRGGGDRRAEERARTAVRRDRRQGEAAVQRQFRRRRPPTSCRRSGRASLSSGTARHRPKPPATALEPAMPSSVSLASD